jgi:hypothetical protein
MERPILASEQVYEGLNLDDDDDEEEEEEEEITFVRRATGKQAVSAVPEWSQA